MRTIPNYRSRPSSPKPFVSRYSVLTILGLLLSLGACNPSDMGSGSITMPEVELRTTADSLAYRAYEAAGGPEMWAGSHIPYVRFNFTAGGTPRRHLWNRKTGQYRLEYEIKPDTSVVVLFNARDAKGTAYLNGAAAQGSRNESLVSRAHRAFVNDTYWLLMPTKLFDEGVQRSLVPDSSDSETGVIRLTFEGVGYTPEDNYWLWINRDTGLIDHWNYLLQGRSKMSTAKWIDYKEFDADGLSGRLSTRKVSPDGSFVIDLSPLEMPLSVDGKLFTSPEGSLSES